MVTPRNHIFVAALAILAAVGTPRAAAAQQGGTIVGIVTTLATGAPLPGVDATLMESGRATFGDEGGRFVFRNVAPGTFQLRVRRLGFTPVTVPVTVIAGGTDTVRVALPLIALRLASVRVSDDACGRRGGTAPDNAAAAILEQVQINAERSLLFSIEYPFQLLLERMVGDEGGGESFGYGRVRIDTVRVDTAVVSGQRAWRYAPGKLIVPAENEGKVGAKETFVVPQLSDFADPVFVAAHCYRYVGVRPADGRRMIQVDFVPARGVPEPDVSGSIWLDTTTYEIRRSTLTVERPAPDMPVVTWTVKIDTWFRLTSAGHSVIDRIASRTTATSANTRMRFGGAAIENQRLIQVQYLRAAP